MKKSLLFLLLFVAWCSTSNKARAQWSYDSVTFEQVTDKIVIENSGDNIWQIGTPQKTFFNSAHSGIKAIVTDTVNDYPPDDTSRFIYIIRNPYTQTCYTTMEFWHKYDMDPAGDKGIIDASYDGGLTWEVVKDTSDFDPWWGSWFWWDADYHQSSGEYTEHPLVTTGTSDGWIRSIFGWQWFITVSSADSIVINPDSLMIRFTFISDASIDNKEGWMIDDILTSSAGWEICAGVSESALPKAVSVNPNPFSDRTCLHCDIQLKDAQLTLCNTSGQIVRQQAHISSQDITIYRDNLPAGLYFLLLREDHKMIGIEKLIII